MLRAATNLYSPPNTGKMSPKTIGSDVGIEVIPVMTGTFLSGAMMSLFLLTIPVILETTTVPSQLLNQWHRIFYRGHIQGPLISIATGLLYSYAAYQRSQRGAAWKPFAVSAAVTVAMIPFTWVFMANVNNSLFRAVAVTEKGGEGNWNEAQGLVRSWGAWNAVRALFPLSGAVLGLLSTCKIVSF
ncbi:anthrone oxidase-like protein [Dothistroma septosporum NZE10]|uniref:Monooxygenase hypC n=1 Tax=Dothistroma septosporum (strain NZE10 / CBS 128990) TaxID=675120 RepID=HYPC_DOTSN|nr:RecName: Full=Monooxygenase hypC; AltName: Full=Dothistromin biosynthesis protein hypC [Dothistroma septosporum NZE10]EME39098.1 anthrone oxidase-like protein [Dothistroma septosporum NZE10]